MRAPNIKTTLELDYDNEIEQERHAAPGIKRGRSVTPLLGLDAAGASRLSWD